MKNIDRNINPNRFQVLACDHKGCGSREELQEDRYNDRVICTTCLNEIAAELALEDESNEKEGYYTEYSYNDLITERNS